MACPSGKIRYRTELDARIALSRIQRDGEKQERSWSRCPICRGFHLTSKKHSNRRS